MRYLECALPFSDATPRQDVTIPTPVEARTVRDRVVRAVAEKARKTDPQFSEAARTFVLRHLFDHGRTSGEVLTLECKRAGILPHDDRAFGSVYAVLQRHGLIERAGTVQRMRGHGCAGGHLYILTAQGRERAV